MIKIKTYQFSTIANNQESLNELLAGASGVTRKIIWFTCDEDADIFARIYVGADQMVNLECDLVTTGSRLIPVDIPVPEGTVANCGFYNLAAGNVTPSFAIGYEETG